VQYGGGKRANIPGYFVGGKTGTSEVLVNGRYLKRSNIGSFVGAFPINDPKYAIIVLIDQAKSNKYNNWLTIGGIVAAPVAGNIIKRSGPLLGVWPQEDQTEQVDKDLALDFTPSYKPLVPATQ
jgi:cell division protein FtsI (penicillin-binding protein 3)